MKINQQINFLNEDTLFFINYDKLKYNSIMNILKIKIDTKSLCLIKKTNFITLKFT